MKLLNAVLGTRWIAITWTLIILILMCLPGPMIPKEENFVIPNFDKFVHSLVFAVLVWLWCLYYRKTLVRNKQLVTAFFYIFLISATYGIGMEFVQKYFIPMREFSLGDIIADLLGTSIAYGFCNVRLLSY